MNGSYKPLPAADELWELFEYNPLTGNLHWRQGKKRAKRGAEAGCIRSDKRYFRIVLDRVEYAKHRIVWCWIYGEDPGQQPLDHINGDKADNRAWNLRTATKSQNQWNKAVSSNNTSGYKGVRRSRSRWRAQIRKHGKRYDLGTYGTRKEAYQAYCDAAHRLHGNFARLR